MSSKVDNRLASPCISICKISESTNICEGCYRTRDEIRTWARAENDDVRHEILAIIKDRRKAMGITSAMDEKPRRRKKT